LFEPVTCFLDWLRHAAGLASDERKEHSPAVLGQTRVFTGLPDFSV
jgi:hypothetical protein